VAGYPVIPRFGTQGDMMAGAGYEFPLSGEADACNGIKTPGREANAPASRQRMRSRFVTHGQTYFAEVSG